MVAVNMKKVLKSFAKHAPYPWEEWFSQKEFVLTRGKDFDCQTHGMVAQIRTAVKKHLPKKAKVSIEVVEEEIKVRRVK